MSNEPAVSIEQVDEMPKEGQFVAVWEHDDTIRSGTYIWEDGKLYQYDECVDGYLSGINYKLEIMSKGPSTKFYKISKANTVGQA